MLKKYFLKFYNLFLLRTDKKTFAFLFNIRNFIGNKSSRVRWLGDFFEVTDNRLPNFKYIIRHQTQCNEAYTAGIIERATNLSKVFFLDRIDFKEGDVVMDCGANVGDLKIWFTMNNINITYIGFEPSPIEFQALKENVYPSEVHNIGLWKTEESLDFYINSQLADSSFITPINFYETIRINALPLERFVNQDVKLLKLDAEGGEPEVILGLLNKIKHIEYISADLDFERGIHKSSTLAPVINLLLDRGFEIIDFSNNRICVLFRNKTFSSSKNS